MPMLAAAAAATGAAMPLFLQRSNSNAKVLHHSKHRFTPRFSLRCSFSSPKVVVPNVVDILRERGLVESISSKNLRKVCSNPSKIPLKVYCGFDPTAKSLHLGNLIGLIVLAWFQRCGHNIVALIGDATARIGDPSGKRIERPELDVETIQKNSSEIRVMIDRMLRRASKEVEFKMGCQIDEFLNSSSKSSGNSFLIVDNFYWWKEITALYFFKDVEIHVTIGNLLANESLKERLRSGERISYADVMYQLFQCYDFLYMFKNMGVNVQIGGSDQWGNITLGIKLIRKMLQVKNTYGLTFPLLLKPDGSKFGKSENDAIWLSPDMFSPYKFYQYFFSVPDADVVRFLKIFTFLNLEEIQEIEKDLKKSSYVSNSAQKRLAEEVTLFVHGEEGLVEALKVTETLKSGA